MKKILLILAFALPIGLSSCGEEDPPNNVYALKYSHNGLVTYACCYNSGNKCSKIGWEVVRTSFKSYAEKDDVKGFFINENWQQSWPELASQPDLIQEIIAQNPKAVFLNEVAFVLLKDRNKPVSEDNTLYGFFDRAADEPCAGYPGTTQ
jgi:hypothetical protein